ncbi:hypothetical protein Trydic_g3972 [Trypoxylus dichotomus]
MWKLTRVRPVLKNGDISDVSNYRPISILSNIAKVFESALHMTIYPQISPFPVEEQHGFVDGKSTVTNLCTFLQYASEVIHSQGQVDVLYTDISKAFDRIDRGIFLRKLEDFRFDDSLVRLLQSCPYQRKFLVSYNSYTSKICSVTSGVPQGSNRGPLLFSTFINNLLKLIDYKTLVFADDVKLYRKNRVPDDYRWKVIAAIEMAKPKQICQNIAKEEQGSLKELISDKHFKILPADKRNTIVIMDITTAKCKKY